MLSTSLYKNVDVLRLLVKAEVLVCEDSDRLLKKMNDLVEILKYCFAKHISMHGEDEDPFHDVKFGLLKVSRSERMEVNYEQCIAQLSIVNDISDPIGYLSESMVEELEDAKNKLLLLMGHKIHARV